MNLMRLNQLTLKDGLAGEHYCTFGYSAGALYATILIDLEKFHHNVIKTSIDFAKQLYAA